jgi:hypothetical protein
LPFAAADALARVVETVGPGYVLPELTAGELESEAVCAKVVSRVYWAAFGREDDLATARGERPGGALAERTGFRPGDILGLHYELSLYNDRPKACFRLARRVRGRSVSNSSATCWRVIRVFSK